jgi:UDP-2-acetamido-2-deoxy-ribo-hexuluronate aminotransferase
LGIHQIFRQINKIAKKYKLAVIEDAAQSFGAYYKNKKSGNLTSIGCTSFFPSKPLGSFGDAGAIFTNNKILFRKMKSIRTHGQHKRNFHDLLGINGRIDTLAVCCHIRKTKVF